MTKKKPDILVTILMLFLVGAVLTGYSTASKEEIEISPEAAYALGAQIEP